MEEVTFLASIKCNFKCKHCFVSDGKEIEKELVDTFSISFYTEDILGVNPKFYEKYYQKTIDNLKQLTEKLIKMKF